MDLGKYQFVQKMIIKSYNRCGLKKYNFEECKYIYLEIEKMKIEKNNLQDLIEEWENNCSKEKQLCSMCLNTSEDTFVQRKLYTSPEILIIILNKNLKNFALIFLFRFRKKIIC